MATPEEAHSISATVASGDYRIDSLLWAYKWDGPLGTPAALTFSFPTANSVWTVQDYQDFKEPWHPAYAPFSPEQAEAVRHILQQYAEVANLTFTEITETGTSVGDLRFAWTGPVKGGGGWTYVPWPSPAAGDVWFNVSYPLDGVDQGDFGYQALVHEVGHALGLQHPFEGPVVLPPAESGVRYTAMSYNYPSGSVGSPMLYDILTLQYMYGANMSTRTGDDVYSVEPGYFPRTIWDAGGNDTLSAASIVGFNSLVKGTTIDLREGRFSEFPRYYTDESGTHLVLSTNPVSWAIAYGVVIENAVGSTGDDRITGNSSANVLEGGAGNDTLDGGAGSDTAAFSGLRSAHTIGVAVNSVTGPDGNDSLTSIERLQFSDEALAFDMGVNEAGGKTALLLGACLGSDGLGDETMVGGILDYFDLGYTLGDAATFLVGAGIVAQLAGGADNEHFVDWIYENLVGSQPDSGTEAELIGYITSGQFTQATFLAAAAGLPINQEHIGLVGLQQNGMEFV